MPPPPAAVDGEVNLDSSPLFPAPAFLAGAVEVRSSQDPTGLGPDPVEVTFRIPSALPAVADADGTLFRRRGMAFSHPAIGQLSNWVIS